jgi:DNA-binding MarR family transcriptional regulator
MGSSLTEQNFKFKERKMMTQTKLSKQQRAILAALREQSPLAIKALYEPKNLVARASTSRAISRLRDRNLVERVSIEYDRRRIPAVRLKEINRF